jgi:hypothetical protein
VAKCVPCKYETFAQLFWLMGRHPQTYYYSAEASVSDHVGKREVRELSVVHVEEGEPGVGDDSPPSDFNQQYAILLRKVASAVENCPFLVGEARVCYDNEGAWHFRAEVFDPDD